MVTETQTSSNVSLSGGEALFVVTFPPLSKTSNGTRGFESLTVLSYSRAEVTMYGAQVTQNLI